MIYIEKSTLADTPLCNVLRRWDEVEKFLLFHVTGVRDIRPIDEHTICWNAQLAGTNVEWTGTIHPPRPDQEASTGSRSSSAIVGSLTVEAVDPSHCRITSRLEFDPDKFSHSPTATPGQVIKQILGDLGQFRQFLERSTGSLFDALPRVIGN